MIALFSSFSKFKNHLVELLILALPMMAGNLGQMLIGATDVFVAARYNIDSLAAVSIANSIIFSVFIVGVGLMTSISIILSNMRGDRKPTKKYYGTSTLYGFILSILFTFICLATIPLVDLIGFEPKLIPTIKEYIFICSFSFPGMYLYQAIKEFLQAHEIVNVPNMILLIAVVFHLFFDFVLVFGFGPIPSMGVMGLAIATLITRTLMGIAMFLYCIKLIKFKAAVNLDYVRQLLVVGMPIGVSLLLEFLAFNMITILIGRQAGIYAATHNIVMTVSSMTFMVPLAISNAIAIKVGYHNGAKDYSEIVMYSKVGIAVSTVFMAICAMAILIFPIPILKLFTSDARVLEIGLPIMLVAGLYQIADGFQVAASGVLKGLKMTKLVSACVLSGYWLVGLPFGILLAYKFDMLLLGFWIGLAVSLGIMGIIMALLIVYKLKKLHSDYCEA